MVTGTNNIASIDVTNGTFSGNGLTVTITVNHAEWDGPIVRNVTLTKVTTGAPNATSSVKTLKDALKSILLPAALQVISLL